MCATRPPLVTSTIATPGGTAARAFPPAVTTAAAAATAAATAITAPASRSVRLGRRAPPPGAAGGLSGKWPPWPLPDGPLAHRALRARGRPRSVPRTLRGATPRAGRGISGCAHRSRLRSASGSPRKSASAFRNRAAACSGGAPDAVRTDASKRSASSSPGATRSWSPLSRDDQALRRRAACATARRRRARVSQRRLGGGSPLQIVLDQAVGRDRAAAREQRGAPGTPVASRPPAGGCGRPPRLRARPRIRNWTAPLVGCRRASK